MIWRLVHWNTVCQACVRVGVSLCDAYFLMDNELFQEALAADVSSPREAASGGQVANQHFKSCGA